MVRRQRPLTPLTPLHALSPGTGNAMAVDWPRRHVQCMTERVQKMARINVDPDAWSALRIRALQHNRSPG
jgi:hypothetical protein